MPANQDGTWTDAEQWVDARGQEWLVSFTWLPTGERLECIGFSVEHPRHGAATSVTTSVLREVPFGELREASRQAVLASAWWSRGMVEVSYQRGEDGDWHATERPAMTGAQQATADAVLATELPDVLDTERKMLRVAEVYAAACWANDKAPVKSVMRAFGIARPTAGRWVHRARTEYGFLEPTEARMQNGRLTAKAITFRAMLDDQGADGETP